MKTIKLFVFLFLTAMLSTALLSSCQKIDFPEMENIDNLESNLIIKTTNGYSSAVGVIYVQKGVATGFKVEPRPGATSAIVEATWTIEGVSYSGLQTWHKFTGLGQVSVSVSVKFQNGTTENRVVTVTSLTDISQGDPVKVFVTNNNNGTWNLLFLLSKERISHATDTNFYYVGNINGWQQTLIPYQHKRYNISPAGQPVTTTDVGKYIGVSLTKSSSLTVHSFALVHSGGSWANFSGSAFVKQDNPDLILFTFHSGDVIPQGDSYTGNMPGVTGDAYFRFTQTGDTLTGKVNLYFKLASNFTSSAFAVRQLPGGTYTSPIQLYSVPGHNEWGQIELPIGEMYGKVSSFRYGPNSSQPTVYSTNMNKSFFYDPFFKDLRVLINKIY